MRIEALLSVIPTLFVRMRFLRSPFLASVDIATQARVLMTDWGGD